MRDAAALALIALSGGWIAACGGEDDPQTPERAATPTTKVASACAEHPELRNAAPPAGPARVAVYFGCDADSDPQSQALYLRVRPVPTNARSTSGRLRTALRALIRGPSRAERRDGYISALPAAPELLRSVQLEGGTATVDFAPALAEVNNLGTSNVSSNFLAQLRAVIFQFDAVETARLQLDGSCMRFWRILQGSCAPLKRAT